MNEDKIYIASNLKHLRIVNKKTQEDIAKLCDKKNTAISNWEKGIREPDSIDLAKISNYFNVSIDDLMKKDLRFDNAEYIDISTSIVNIPVLGVIKAGIPIEAQEDVLEYVDIPKNWVKGNKKYYGLKIQGDSMYPKYEENDIVIFEQIEDYEMANKKDCAVMVNGDDATFKNVTITESGITLIPLNVNNSDGYQPTFYDQEQIKNKPVRIIGIAREKRTRL